MKIIVFSDSHKNYHSLQNIVETNKSADMFIHLGDGYLEYSDVSKEYPDKEFRFVKGNCDYGLIDSPEELIIDLNGVNTFCSHGHKYRVNHGIEPLAERAQILGCQIALYGHTHIYKTEVINGIYIMNPGSVETPRGKNPPSYGIIEIDDNGKISMNIAAM